MISDQAAHQDPSHSGRFAATRRRGTPRSGGDLLADWAVVAFSLALGAVTLAYLWGDRGETVDSLDVIFGVLACAALWIRRSRPTETFVVVFVANLFSPLALGAGLVALFNAALRTRGRRLFAVVAMAVADAVVFPLVNPQAVQLVSAPAFPASLLGFIALAVGLYVRARRELVESLRERAVQLEAEQDRSVAEARETERRRIAREMHDVLAHRLSLLAIHAGALEFRPDSSSAEIAQAAGVIRSSAAAALEELSQIITVLREDTPNETAPAQPTLADLPQLLDESRTAGMHLRARLDLPDTGAYSSAAERAAYRVVQEGLTNARKHAPGSPVDLDVTTACNGDLAIQIVSRPDPAVPPAGQPAAVGARSGLLGLAERLALVGGTLEHRHNEAGEFVMRASVPAE